MMLMEDPENMDDKFVDDTDFDGKDEESEPGRRRLEGVFREALRKAVEKGVEAGIGTFERTNKAVRGVASEMPLPKEVASYLFSAVDETKNSLVRVVAGEVRDFLEATDIATELQRALTSLSFEIKTEVRFIPNDKGLVRPSIKAKARPKRKRRRDQDDVEEFDVSSEQAERAGQASREGDE